MRRDKSLMAGLACGLACAVCVYCYASGVESQVEKERQKLLAEYGGQQAEVYVAKRDVASGETLSDYNVEKRLWISELLPDSAVVDLADVDGKPLTSPLYEGQVATTKHVGQQEVEALSVPQGLCAVSVASEPVLSVGGAISRGQRVNVYSSSGTDTDLIAKNIEVLSTSTAADATEDKAQIAWITVAVKPELVKELIMAAQVSELYFTLPSEQD